MDKNSSQQHLEPCATSNSVGSDGRLARLATAGRARASLYRKKCFGEDALIRNVKDCSSYHNGCAEFSDRGCTSMYKFRCQCFFSVHAHCNTQIDPISGTPQTRRTEETTVPMTTMLFGTEESTSRPKLGPQRLSKTRACRHTAWIVSLASTINCALWGAHTSKLREPSSTSRALRQDTQCERALAHKEKVGQQERRVRERRREKAVVFVTCLCEWRTHVLCV